MDKNEVQMVALQADNDKLTAEVHQLRATSNVVKWKGEKARADQLNEKVKEKDGYIGVLLSKHDAHAKQVKLNLEANARAYKAEKRLHILAEVSAHLIQKLAFGEGYTTGDLDAYATTVKELLISSADIVMEGVGDFVRVRFKED